MTSSKYLKPQVSFVLEANSSLILRITFIFSILNPKLHFANLIKDQVGEVCIKINKKEL